MKIHQFVHTLNYGDAISGEAIAIKRLLERLSIESTIYALHAHEKVKSDAVIWTGSKEQLADLQALGSEDSVILHYSIASPFNAVFEQLTGTKRGLIYHNLTPVHWFEGYNNRVVKDLELGFEELPSLLKHADFVLADSEFNRAELGSFGRSDAKVLPLLLDEDKWKIETNSGISQLLNSTGEVNLLHVGRIAPNKCIHDIIKSFYFYHHKIERNSKLWLVGIDIDTELYAFELRRLISKLQLSEAVEFVGSVADSELRAFYENCDAYLCMSEHEGFCLPLLEAMYFGLPVIAYDACAVAGTLGDAGLLIDQKDPAKLAELVKLLLSDVKLREQIQERGRARAAEFNPAQFEKLFRELVLSQISPGTNSEASAPKGLGVSNAESWA
jgi:glycosyltransferase involved in cell wall biosynthesis